MLTLLADEAKVRTPHIFHCMAFLKEMKGKFSVAAYAKFSGLETRHVERIIAVLDLHGITWKTAGKMDGPKAARLSTDFKVPDEWILWAITQRRWKRDVADTVAQEFVDYWSAKAGKDACKTDWKATWRNWVRRSYTPDGEMIPEYRPKHDPEKVANMLDLYRRRDSGEYDFDTFCRERDALLRN